MVMQNCSSIPVLAWERNLQRYDYVQVQPMSNGRCVAKMTRKRKIVRFAKKECANHTYHLAQIWDPIGKFVYRAEVAGVDVSQ